MTPEQAASASRPAVQELGGAFAECPKTLRRARQLGLTGWAFYVTGWGGALGDVGPETLAATLGFVAADAVQEGWESGRRVDAPIRIAEHYLAECCRWGRERLDALPGVDRLVVLAERVVLAADPAGLPLFAAWRAMPVPDDAPGARAAVLVRLLREHRMAAQLLAVRSAGMTPLESLLAGPEGAAGAIAYGWQPPFPPFEPLVRRRVWADAITDRITGGAYRILEASERHELVGLLNEAVQALRMQAGQYPAVG
ncbi:evbL [Rugosimonospora acidiphila]|uniref:EvbL n=1 Tax=Rugosimonospora acidiphila TaxID=556531 RepID=A0ABP9RRG7_9ACTN